jgi:uncharacterized membrane protein YfcA
MFDPKLSLAGLLVGFVVGLTGMGGGALMTPILVLLFGVEPLAAVSSDIVASLIMKPVGGAVHWRHGTVDRKLVFWLMLGSVPAAFAGVLLLKFLGSGASVQDIVRITLGVALLMVSLGLAIRPLLKRNGAAVEHAARVVVRPLPTMLIGVLGGLVVGIASVGSGSLIIVSLLILYPSIRLSDLVGTDLVQAVPLIASAAVGHLLFGDFRLGITASILVGSLPGVYLGARCSSRAPDHVIRPALSIVLLSSALKLLGVGTVWVVMVFAALTAIAIGRAAMMAQARRQRRVAADVVNIESREPSYRRMHPATKVGGNR